MIAAIPINGSGEYANTQAAKKTNVDDLGLFTNKAIANHGAIV